MSRIDGEYLEKLQVRYRNASKKERTIILDEVVKTTGYHRKYATALLNGKRERVQGPIRRPRRREYGAEEADAIMILADLFDNPVMRNHLADLGHKFLQKVEGWPQNW